MDCPKCGSTKTRKDGRSRRTGKQQYRCNNCGHYFAEDFSPKLNIKCLYCDSDRIHRDGKNHKGIQRYQCQNCGKVFDDEKIALTRLKEYFVEKQQEEEAASDAIQGAIAQVNSTLLF